MIVSEDSDFLYRLFRLGGAVRSEASPVRQIKEVVFEPDEAPNLSSASLDLPYLWALRLETLIRKLPKSIFEEHSALIRTAKSALSCRETNQVGRAIVSLSYALWWEVAPALPIDRRVFSGQQENSCQLRDDLAESPRHGLP
jgi:hypothetical protein